MKLKTALHTGIALLLISAAPEVAWPVLVPASVFTDNMVLQREQSIPVWGTAEPGADIAVGFDNAFESCVADSTGRWMAVLDPLPANARPQTLEIRGDNCVVSLANVLVGDVWLCSGQSNMQMTLGESAGGNEFAQRHGDNPLIRLMMVPKQFSADSRASQDGKWSDATPEAARRFSAVGFSFGVTLAASPKMRDTPIGLIDSSFGGTTVEAWIPADDLKLFKAKDLGNSLFGKPTEHYNAMIHPLIPMAIRGVVWYQGESNADRSEVYARLLTTMIGVWRRDFRNPTLPFIVIQLPAYNAPFQNRFFTWVRERQAHVADQTEGVSLVVTYDTHDGLDLHPREKITIGQRVANVARKAILREPLAVSGPTYKSHSIRGAQVRVTFETHGEKLATKDDSATVHGFQLAGSDGEYYFASGTILGHDTVMVSADEVDDPKTIRFAWGGVPQANLTNTSLLPTAPFRTDAFQPDDVEFVRVPARRAVKTPTYEVEIDASGRLRSLIVGGEQFVANEVGMNGGASIPTFFGPRLLNQVEEIGPNRLVFRDSEVVASYSFAPDAVQITIENKSGSEIVFQIALAPNVSVVDNVGAMLRKGNARLQTKGLESPAVATGDQIFLRATVPGGDSRSLRLDTQLLR